MTHPPDLMQPLYRLYPYCYHFLHILVVHFWSSFQVVHVLQGRDGHFCHFGERLSNGVAGNFIAWSSSGFLRLPRRPAFLPTFSGGCRGAKYRSAVAPQSCDDFGKLLKAWILWCAKVLVPVYEFCNWINLVDCVKHVFSNSWHFPSNRWDWSSCDARSSIGPLRQFGFFMGDLHNCDRAARSVWRKELLAPCLRQDPPLRLGFSNFCEN